jgi:hypothetical protein
VNIAKKPVMILTMQTALGIDTRRPFHSAIAAILHVFCHELKMLARRFIMLRLTIAAVSCFLVCHDSIAQQNRSDTLPDAPSQTQQTANPIQGSVQIFKLLRQKSLVFPDLATTQGPLSSWEKFKLAANNSVALSTVGGVAIGSAFRQAINSPSGYHQGAEGYGKRFGAGMARVASGNIFGTFLLASALHQDPRFYVKNNLSFKQSVEYSAVRVIFTRSDSGGKQVNYSGLIGPLMSEGLANAYYPDENRTVGSTFTRYASDLGWKFGGNLLRQYWPSINRKLRLAPESSPTNP